MIDIRLMRSQPHPMWYPQCGPRVRQSASIPQEWCSPKCQPCKSSWYIMVVFPNAVGLKCQVTRGASRTMSWQMIWRSLPSSIGMVALRELWRPTCFNNFTPLGYFGQNRLATGSRWLKCFNAKSLPHDASMIRTLVFGHDAISYYELRVLVKWGVPPQTGDRWHSMIELFRSWIRKSLSSWAGILLSIDHWRWKPACMHGFRGCVPPLLFRGGRRPYLNLMLALIVTPGKRMIEDGIKC